MASFSPDDWKELYSPEDNPAKVRLIGIEFEGKPKPADKLDDKYKFYNGDYLREQGIGVEQDEDGHKWYDESKMWDKTNEELKKLGLVYGGVGCDGGGREIVSCPDSFTLFEQGGSERLKNLIDFLKESTTADVASGTHFHISKLETDVKKTWNNIYWFCMVFGPQLQKIFGRISGWAHIPLPENYFTERHDCDEKIFEAPHKQPIKTQSPGYNKLSFVVERENRYEFRAAKASHDLDEILAWAEIYHSIVEICANGYIQDVPFGDILRGKYARAYINKLNKESKERKITPAERAMRISSVGYVRLSERPRILK